jgi:small subunit ribosomal protein S17
VTTGQAEAPRPSRGQTIVGTVARLSGQKSVVVTTETRIRHSRYLKVIRQITHVKAHDEASQCREGDLVEVRLTRPISRTKRWRVVRVIKKALALSSTEASS